jgi:hypothetical protein
MLMRSTGLGKTQLTGSIKSVKRQGDYLIMSVGVTDPVKWTVRVGVSHRDMVKVITSVINPSAISFVLSPRQMLNKNPKHPGEF